MKSEIDNSPALQSLLDGINKMADELMCSEFDRKRAEDRLVELEKQLEDKYSTDTHILVTRELLSDAKTQFEHLRGGFEELDGQFDDIHNAVNNAADECGYNDASSYSSDADTYVEKFDDILHPKTEEVTE